MRQACARTCGARLRGGRGSRWCWWQSWHAYSTPPLRADPSVTVCVRDVATAPDCVVAMGPVEVVMAAIGARGRTLRPWPLPQVRLREYDGYVSNQIGRAHVCTSVTYAHLVCSRLLVKQHYINNYLNLSM